MNAQNEALGLDDRLQDERLVLVGPVGAHAEVDPPRPSICPEAVGDAQDRVGRSLGRG